MDGLRGESHQSLWLNPSGNVRLLSPDSLLNSYISKAAESEDILTHARKEKATSQLQYIKLGDKRI